MAISTATGYRGSTGTQGSKVRSMAVILPDLLVVKVDCPVCGRVTEQHEGNYGATGAGAAKAALHEAHMDCYRRNR